MMNWIRCDERLPEKEGVYLVTILNREWNRDRSGIEDGIKPPKDEYWEQHKDLYGQLPDGRWVKVEQRVFHDGIWSGYMETVLAWMQMPGPYGAEEQLQLDLTVDAEQVRHGEWVCIEFDGYADGNEVPITLECSLCNHNVDAENESRYCPNCGAKMDGERREDEAR